VEYFNVSKALVQQGEAITFRCGGTRELGEDGEVLSLMLHIRKWFTGSERKWLLAVNEQVEVLRDADRYESKLRRLGLVREVEFTIFGKNLKLIVFFFAEMLSYSYYRSLPERT